jgi:Helix-hairpin-helix motif
MRGIVLCSALLFFGNTVHAQDSSTVSEASPDFESMMENSTDDGTGKTATLDGLETFRMNPVEVNTASFQDLASVPFLSEPIAMKILCLRDSLGILSPDDLRMIPGMDGQTLSLVLPYISFSSGKTRRNSSVSVDSLAAMSFRSRSIVDIHPQKQFLDGEYSGSPLAQYDRLEIRTPRWSGGILFDKDAGETMSNGFVSGYIGLDNDGIVKKFVAGDFTINNGEGLMLSSPRSSSKGGSALYQIKATGRTIVPHLATDEYHYFQGAAATMGLYPADITIFLSRKPVAANLDSAGSITSFYSSGLFRSQTEIKKRDAAYETAIGGIIDVQTGSASMIGLSALKIRYDKQVAVQSPSLLNRDGVLVFGAHSNFVVDAFTVFGEIAGNSIDAASGVAGCICRVSKRLSLSAQLRSYSSNYTDPHAYGFGEQNGVVNGEIGRYLGMEYQASPKIKISTSYDEFTLPSSGGFPKSGSEYLVRCECALKKSINVSLQFKNTIKTVENTLNDASHIQQKIFEDRNQQNLRASCSCALNKWMEFTQRIELTGVAYSISHNCSEGLLMFTEFNLAPARSSFYGTARMIVFDTQSYDSRVYEYESDVPGGYSFPPLYGRGSRWYIVSGWKVSRSVALSCKYSETFQVSGATSGTGNSAAIGPLDNRVTMQVDIGL